MTNVIRKSVIKASVIYAILRKSREIHHAAFWNWLKPVWYYHHSLIISQSSITIQWRRDCFTTSMRDSFVAGPFLINKNSCAQMLMREEDARAMWIENTNPSHHLAQISSNCFHEKWTFIPKCCHEIWILWIDLGSNVFPGLLLLCSFFVLLQC